MKAIFLDKDSALVDKLEHNVEPRRIRLSSGAGPALLSRIPVSYTHLTLPTICSV